MTGAANPFHVGDWASVCYVNDMYPCEVVAVTPTTVTVRDLDGRGEHGPFTPNPNGRVRTFRRSRKPDFRGDFPYRAPGGGPRLSLHARFYQSPEV